MLALAAGTAACASQARYRDLEAAHAEQRRQWMEEQRALQSQMAAVGAENTRLQEEAALSEERRARVERINTGLHARLMELEQEVAQRESAVAARSAETASLRRTREMIDADLAAEIASQDIRLEEREGGLQVVLADPLLFPEGDDVLSPRGQQALLKLATALREAPGHLVLVEGHMDQGPLGGEASRRWADPWAISVARATAVVRFLEAQAAVPGGRMAACGRGAHHPMAADDSEEGRRWNRRIEVILAPPR